MDSSTSVDSVGCTYSEFMKTIATKDGMLVSFITATKDRICYILIERPFLYYKTTQN
jgi:hypothetical protein